MAYVDGFVAAVPTANKSAYQDYAAKLAELFAAHGATQVVDCWGDDVPDGQITSFPMAVKIQDDETVVFGWITWPSKAVHDEAWPKLMQDPLMAGMDQPKLFDGKRMIFGGFEVLPQN